MSTNPAAVESRLRRRAARQGLQLVKSRVRDPQRWDYATFTLINPYVNCVVAGPGLTLEAVEAELDERR